jgi:hypothetical protein
VRLISFCSVLQFLTHALYLCAMQCYRLRRRSLR